MRKIKFRAWNDGKKDWEGNFSISSIGSFLRIGISQSTEGIHVMQFTGLLDKNGKEIFIGDVVRIKEDWEEYGWKAGEVGNIIFENYYIGISLKSQNKPGTRYTVMADINDGRDVEVIGNIYESPELLTNNK